MKLAVTLLAAAAVMASPAVAVAQPAHGKPWKTCTPQATVRYGPYRIDNDLFTGRRGPSCITVVKSALTITRNYQPQPGGVVAYPDVRYGPWFGSGDGEALLPSPVTAGPDMRVTATGHATGTWLTDADSFIYSSVSTRQQWVAEIVVGVRYRGWGPSGQIRYLKIGRRHWGVDHHGTCDASACWPLTVFWAVRQGDHRVLPMRQFEAYMLRRHWLTEGDWLGNVKFGTECWSGCRGLTDGLTVTAGPHYQPPASP